MSRRGSFDFAEVCRAISRAASAEERVRLIDGDPRKQRIADHLAAIVAQAPPLTPEQRAGIRAVLRGAPGGGGDA